MAGDQLAGKGRGANTWLSSKGCLQFTMLLHHRDASTLTLIQYLVGLAMVEAILSEPGHHVRLFPSFTPPSMARRSWGLD